MSKIYDSFIFFNEIDTLNLRLNILDPVVDYFILCEADTTHSGQPKPFYFEENKAQFEKFLPKIIHLKITDMPTQFTNLPIKEGDVTFDEQCLNTIYSFIHNTTAFNRGTELYFGRDFFQKECTRRGMINCQDDDIILSSDVDEIPNPEILKNAATLFSNTDSIYSFKQRSYYYYLNVLQSDDWLGTRMGTYGRLKNYSFNELRRETNTVIEYGGWHFSFQGGAERVKHKINSYSHQDLNTDDIRNSIETKIENNVDPFGRSVLQQVPIDDSFPKYLRENTGKYSHMIK